MNIECGLKVFISQTPLSTRLAICSISSFARYIPYFTISIISVANVSLGERLQRATEPPNLRAYWSKQSPSGDTSTGTKGCALPSRRTIRIDKLTLKKRLPGIGAIGRFVQFLGRLYTDWRSNSSGADLHKLASLYNALHCEHLAA